MHSLPNPADRELLKGFLISWVKAQANGVSISPAQFCAERPDLVGPLQECIAQILRDNAPGDPPSIAGDGLTTDFVSHLVDTQFFGTSKPIPPPSHPSAESLKGEFAGFKLMGVLGEGGFGTVYRAEDTKLHRKVALKVMHPAALAREGARDLFLAEAKALAAVQNDHVVPVFQVGEAEGQLFLVMPLLAGETLAARLERTGALPIAEVRRIGREIADGLAAIHAKGLIHRDLKPANIWLEADTQRVKVLDLGLAHDPQTSNEWMAGTPAYMSPEQVAGAELDFRSDLFSLGAVLYECATGRRAYSRASVKEVLRAIREDAPPAPSKANPAIPSQLSSVIEQLQRKNPVERPSSARALQTLLSDEPTSPSPLKPTPTTSSRWPLIGGVALACLVVGFLIWQSLPKGSTKSISRPTSDAPSESIHSAEINPTEIGPPRIADFDITHYARVEDGSKVENRGIFGKTTWTAKQKDLVTLNLKLTRPAYTYLLAFRPDGVMELCFPEEEHVIPPLSAEASYPFESASRTKGYGLSESPGLWVFTAIVSESPLPAFGEWKQSHPLPTPKNSQGLRGVVLVDDGQSIDQLRAAGAQRGTRGKGEEIPGQRALETIDDAIKQAAPSALLRSIGILATPAN